MAASPVGQKQHKQAKIAAHIQSLCGTCCMTKVAGPGCVTYSSEI